MDDKLYEDPAVDTSQNIDDEIAFSIIDKYFENNPLCLVKHQLDSYNDFYFGGLERIIKEKNPIKIMKQQDKETNQFKLKANLYIGGKEGNKIYYGKPTIYDENNEHYMYPNEARLRNMTYAITIHYDVVVEFFIAEDDTSEGSKSSSSMSEDPTRTITLEKIFLGKFPIMTMSKLCILRGLSPLARFELGECKNDYGGYFIIDGKEKCIVSQEKFADNMLYVRDSVNELYSHSADIRSVSSDASKAIRTVSVRLVSPSSTYTNNNIVVMVPNVRKPVPLFILMRALGVESDRSIIEHCLLDMDKYNTYVDLFIPSIHDAGMIFNQETALKYMATFTKGKTVPHVLEILSDFFLPHVGSMNFIEKAFFVGHMVLELLQVYKDEKKPTDRDSFRFKRVELTGSLLYDLFREYYTLQQRNIFQKIDKEYHYKQGIYSNNFTGLIELNYKEFFSDRIVEIGFKKAFKGNWGAEAHTKRVGVVQDLNRLSYNATLSHLRKINLPLDSSAKVIGPRLLHSSQWGLIDPVDTPDGGNVGLHKHMSILAQVTTACPSEPLVMWLRVKAGMRYLTEATPFYISTLTKVFVNGNWVGVIGNPSDTVALMKNYRRSALLPTYTSIYWNIGSNTIEICSDAGRLCRPIYYIEDGKISYDRASIKKHMEENIYTWNQLVTGFASKKKEETDNIGVCTYLKVDELYKTTSIENLDPTKAVIEYMDSAEEEAAYIALSSDIIGSKPYTHKELHPSLLFGVMGNQVVFPENNQLPRDLFSCGQSKQAVSMFHTNYQKFRKRRFGKIL